MCRTQLQIKDDMRKHYHLPCNVNFWMMLQLNIGPKGISSPLAKDELNHEAFKYMNKYMLVLNQSMGASKCISTLPKIDSLVEEIIMWSEHHCIAQL